MAKFPFFSLFKKRETNLKNYNNADFARLEAAMQRLSEKQDIVSQSYLRRDDYNKAHDALVSKVETLEARFNDVLTKASLEHQNMKEQWRKELVEHMQEAEKRHSGLEQKFDDFVKEVSDKRVQNLTWVIGMLVSALVGSGVVQVIHQFVGK